MRTIFLPVLLAATSRVPIALLCLAACPALAAPCVRITLPDGAGELPVGRNFRVATDAQAGAWRRIVMVEFRVCHPVADEAWFDDPTVMADYKRP